MAQPHPNAPDRVATPELEPEEKQTWKQFLLRQTPQRRQRRKAGATPVVPPHVPTPEETEARMRQQAQMIDQILNDSDMQENYENVVNRREEFAHLNFQPNIKPKDLLWRDQFLFFLTEINAKSIQDVLEHHFADWQQNLLLPPSVNGVVLDIQKTNTEKYKNALKADFATVFDNMITKLTMVHFGLPVEPFTLNNILRAGTNENDPEDGPQAEPRVQRIMYSEAPLEFLDSYDKRSYGYPMIRTKSQIHLRGAGADEDDLRNADLYESQSDNDSDVYMRGGSSQDGLQAVSKFYIYGPDARIELKRSDADGFRKAAFTLLYMGSAWDSDDDWDFVVDQYNNEDQSSVEKKHVTTFVVTRDNYKKMWINHLKGRVFNKFGFWPMVVNLSRNGGPAPATYIRQLGKPGMRAKPERPAKPAKLEKSVLERPRNSKAALAPGGQVPLRLKSSGKNLLNISSDTYGRNPTLQSRDDILAWPGKKNRTVLSGDTKEPGEPGFVCGYAGKIEIRKGAVEFLNAALDLLHLSDTSEWEFLIDTKRPRRRDLFAAQRVCKENFEHIYKLYLEKQLIGPGWRAFVRRKGSPVPSTWGPEPIVTSVVKLTLENRGTAYWKLPQDPSRRYGVNQLQDDFFRAMQVLFPARLPRAAKNISIDGFPIGFGGMELNDQLLQHLSRRWASNQGTTLEFAVKLDASSCIAMPLGIRVACTTETSVFEKTSTNIVAEIYRSMYEIVSLGVSPRSLPSSFRVWKTAIDRENNAGSVVIQFQPEASAIQDLQSFLGPDLPNLETDCLWFRPEFVEDAVISELGKSAEGVTWKPGTQKTLADFREVLKELYKSQSEKSAGFFEMTDAQCNRRFVIDENTTEEQWRKHVYDCLPTASWCINKNSPFQYAVDKKTPWGLSSEYSMPELVIPAANVYSTTSNSLQHEQGALGSPGPVATFPTASPFLGSNTFNQSTPNPQSGAGGSNSGGATWGGSEPRVSGILPNPGVSYRSAPLDNRTIAVNRGPISRAQAVTRFNKDRIIKARVCHPKPSKWNPWMTQQTRQTDLKHKSWWHDQSVIEPGQKPEVPIFGPAKELVISQGSSFPEVFCHALTPTDIMALKEENRELRNMVFDRRHKCDWCEFTFPNHDAEAKRAHFSEHAQTLKDGGQFCPLCGTEDWMWMSIRDRREHLQQDQEARETEIIKTFWKGITCPVCDLDVSHQKPESVLRHFASHTPEVLKFCDRCGCNQLILTPTEERHHNFICVESEEAHDKRVFCDRCGADQTKKSDKEKLKHTQKCTLPKAGIFCPVCAINLQDLAAYDAQDHLRNCRSPGGPPKAFCTRCGIDRLGLDGPAEEAHHQSCFMVDPRPQVGAKERLELEEQNSNLRKLRAKVRKEQVQLEQDKINFDKLLSTDPTAARFNVGTDHTDPGRAFQNTTRREAADQYQHNNHTSSCGTPVAPAQETIECPHRSECKYKLTLAISEADAFTKHWKQMHTFSDGELLCPFDNPRKKGVACGRPFHFELNPFHASNFTEHVKRAHSQESEFLQCPFGDRNLGCKEDYSVADGAKELVKHLISKHVTAGNAGLKLTMSPSLIRCTLKLDGNEECNQVFPYKRESESAVEYMNHLRDKHFSPTSSSSSSTSTSLSTIHCLVKLTTGVVCGQPLSLGNQGKEVFDHMQDRHSPPVLKPPPMAIGFGRFRCPLETTAKKPCGILINIPNVGDTAAIALFVNHYQHTHRYGGPCSTLLRKILGEFIEVQDKQLERLQNTLEEQRYLSEFEDAALTERSIAQTEASLVELAQWLGELMQGTTSMSFASSAGTCSGATHDTGIVRSARRSPTSSSSPVLNNVSSGGSIGMRTTPSRFISSSPFNDSSNTSWTGTTPTPSYPRKSPVIPTGIVTPRNARKAPQPSSSNYSFTANETETPSTRGITQPSSFASNNNSGKVIGNANAPKTTANPLYLGTARSSAAEDIDTTGFEPSPVEEYFPLSSSKKRKTLGDNSELGVKHLPGESVQTHSNRMKRQKVAAMNMVEYAGENEDESYKPRANSRPRADSPLPLSVPALEGNEDTTDESEKVEVRGTRNKLARNAKRVRGDKVSDLQGALKSPVLEDKAPIGRIVMSQSPAREVRPVIQLRRSARTMSPPEPNPLPAATSPNLRQTRRLQKDVEVDADGESPPSKRTKGSRGARPK